MRNSNQILSVLAGVFASLITVNVSAQVTINNTAPNNTANHLINNVLLGQGVTASNITSYGSSVQRGLFTNGLIPVGIDSGIALASGQVASISPFGPFASTAIPNAVGQGAGDADLLAVAASVPALIGQTFSVNSTWDASIITFDFIPYSDTISFNYVFGSREYTTWINTQYNDAFGFFLSGPGITGPYSNSAINVAIVPGSSPPLPISISTIHPGLNGQFYNTGGTGINYNGYTDVFTAILPVTECVSHTMKLAVADGSDKILDTGVLIEGGSFGAYSGLTITASPTYNPNSSDTAIYEGCGSVTVSLVKDTIDTVADTVYFLPIGGAAINGVDYSLIQNFVIFPAFSDSTTILFDVFYDSIPEPLEDIIIEIDTLATNSNVVSCGNNAGGITLWLKDQPPLTGSTFGDTTINCTDDSVAIGIVMDSTNLLYPLSFTWSGPQIDSAFNVQPLTSQVYTVTVEDACGQQSLEDSVIVNVVTPPFTLTKHGDNQTINCTDGPVVLSVSVDSNWLPGMTFDWSTGSSDSTINAFSYASETYTVTISLPCSGQQEIETFSLNVQNDPVVTETDNIQESAFVCPGDLVTMSVDASGGYPGYTYSWDVGGTSADKDVTPLVTTTYYVTVHDTCALVDYVDSVVVRVPVPDPLEIWGLRNDTVPCQESFVSFGPPIALGGAGPGTYSWSWDNWVTTNPSIDDIIFETKSYTVELTDVCNFDTTSFTVMAIISDKNDLELKMPEDILVCYGDEVELVAEGLEGGGEYTFEWDRYIDGDTLRYFPEKTQTHFVRLTDNCDTSRVDSVTVTVSKVIPAFTFEYTHDYIVQFHNQSRATYAIDSYRWDFGDGSFGAEKEPRHTYPHGEGFPVVLTVKDEFECIDTAQVQVAPSTYLYIPSGFTPDNDGINDVFTIKGLGINEFKIEIFNRWGERVFRSSDRYFEWDGTTGGEKAPVGMYVYKIYVGGDDGQVVERTGNISILR